MFVLMCVAITRFCALIAICDLFVTVANVGGLESCKISGRVFDK